MDAVPKEDLEALYRAAVGPKKAGFNVPKFLKFDQPGASRLSWNWPAFFVPFYWFSISPHVCELADFLSVDSHWRCRSDFGPGTHSGRPSRNRVRFGCIGRLLLRGGPGVSELSLSPRGIGGRDAGDQLSWLATRVRPFHGAIR